MIGILEEDELSSVKVLAFFFFQIRHIESSIRAVKAILAMYPKDIWARAMLEKMKNSVHLVHTLSSSELQKTLTDLLK